VDVAVLIVEVPDLGGDEVRVVVDGADAREVAEVVDGEAARDA
jgi:hypothetical protein